MADLRNLYNNAQVKLRLIRLAHDRCKANPFSSWFRDLGLPILAAKKTQLLAEIDRYFDTLYIQSEEEAKISLFALFERDLYRSAKHISLSIEKRVGEEEFDQPIINEIASLFIKTPEDYDRMHKLHQLLKPAMDVAVFDRFAEIIQHRNHVVHGSRFDKPSSLSLREHFETLELVLGLLPL